MTVDIALLESPPTSTLPLEIVERKGIGHPDTICDALAESVSGALCRFYFERFGVVLHHNVDKALLCGGAARPVFGGGDIIEPIEIHLAGRATRRFRGVDIPVDEIASDCSRQWMRKHLSRLDVERQVRVVTHIRPTSADLSNLFNRGGDVDQRLANDTSFGVGFAPLDTLEQVVLATERELNAPETRAAHLAIGEDIKVMGARSRDDIAVTIACAFVSREVANIGNYFAQKAQLRALATEAARKITSKPLAVEVNTADGESADSIYLTVTGLSAESGDDGQVGRGNRVNGLITPYRPMSLEAAAGKNPLTHVGKLYNVMAGRIAQAVVIEVPEVAEAYCYLLSRIGHPICDPQVFDLKVRLKDARQLGALAPRITEVARTEFGKIDSLWRESIEGTLQLW